MYQKRLNRLWPTKKLTISRKTHRFYDAGLKRVGASQRKLGYGSGSIAVAVIAAYCAWLGLTSQTVATIPPMIFWGSVGIGTAIALILGYSLAWCMARNFTGEDWRSDIAENVVLAALAAFAGDPTSGWYYVIRFLGAYFNYRKRTKTAKNSKTTKE